MTLELAGPVAACLAADGVGPLLAGRGWIRGSLAVAAALGAMLVPFALPGDALFLRAFMSLYALVSLFRVIDLIRDPRRWSVRARLALAYTLVDARRAERLPRPGPPSDAVARLILFAPMLAGGILAADALGPDGGGGVAVARVLVGMATLYAAAESMIAIVRIVYGVAGWDPGPLHRDPIRSRTVAEFWSRRWNLTVARWLDRHAFRPLARRRRPTLGRWAAFAASAAAHAWFVFVPLGGAMAVVIGLFFLAHGGLVVAEARLGVSSWPEAGQRLWTLGAFLGTAPLITEPALAVLALP